MTKEFRAKHAHLKDHYIFDSQVAADLADATYEAAIESGIDINQWKFLFIATLRMFKVKSDWSN